MSTTSQLVFEFSNHIAELLRREDEIIDCAIVGSMSGHYGWQKCNHIDLDLWVLSKRRGSTKTRNFLGKVSSTAAEVFCQAEFDLIECRCIDGPYKPASWTPIGRSVLIHILLDDDYSYKKRSKCTRFAWRKYQCFANPPRLNSLATARPTAKDVRDEPWGVLHSLDILSKHLLSFPEFNITDGGTRILSFDASTPQFLEFCLYATMMNARNYARSDNQAMADSLPNEDFGTWYSSQYGDPFVSKIASIKSKARIDGICNFRYLSVENQVSGWLMNLAERLNDA